jgi:hypothetical protein
MNKALRILIYASLLGIVFYGAGRLYFEVTGGFTIRNITSNQPYDERWKTRTLSSGEKSQLRDLLSQNYHYLGKGCQAYVFLSDDGKYVLKFFKYQRFRTQKWIDLLTFIPPIERYQIAKGIEKKEKLDKVYSSWKLAFDYLQPETGIVYVHLNKSNDLQQKVKIYDKIGFEHTLDLDQVEFMVQKRAEMLTPTIDELMKKQDVEGAKNLISRLVSMVLFEYERGFGDKDHALMQNTGVFEGNPIHIDVGQFVRDENLKEPPVYKQEIFSKTYRFRIWLKKKYPELASYLETILVELIGPEFYKMKPQLKNMVNIE